MAEPWTDDTINIGSGQGAVIAAEFHVGSAATTPDQRVIFDPATRFLLYDPNGSDGDLISQGNSYFATLSPGARPDRVGLPLHLIGGRAGPRAYQPRGA